MNAGRRVGFDYVHCAIDDHTRLAHAEIHPDETTATCAGLLRAAGVFFTTVGIPAIERVLTDNALAGNEAVLRTVPLLSIGRVTLPCLRSPCASVLSRLSV